MIISRPALASSVAFAAAMFGLSACGSKTTTTPITTPSPTPTPVVVATPTPDPLAALKAQCGDPTPGPLYGMKLSVQLDNGFRKLVDSKPVIDNVGRGTPDAYCGKAGFDPNARYCETRPEGNAQRAACDILVVGTASDTGKNGPTWSKDGQPCVAAGSETDPGCTNYDANQFMAVSRGPGDMLACASDVWPATGARCGGCTIYTGGGRCAQ